MLILGKAFEVTGISKVVEAITPFLDTVFKGGSQILWLALDLEFTKYILAIVLGIETGLMVYKIIMWIIKKVPFLSMQ